MTLGAAQRAVGGRLAKARGPSSRCKWREIWLIPSGAGAVFPVASRVRLFW